jgi:Tol biopolymer transport system component
MMDIEFLSPGELDEQSEFSLLIQYSLDGDYDALRKLLGLIFPEVWKVCCWFSPDTESTQVMAEEATHQIIRKLRNYSEQEKFRIWFTKIVIQVCHAENKKEQVPGELLINGQLNWLQIFIDSGKYTNHELEKLFDLKEQLNCDKVISWEDEFRSPNLLQEKLLEKQVQCENAYAGFDESQRQDLIENIVFQYQKYKTTLKSRLVIAELIWLLSGFFLLVFAIYWLNSDSVSATALAVPTSTLQYLPTPQPGVDSFQEPQPYEKTQANAPSYSPAISTDGRFIVFVSDASNLIPGDTNNAADLFVFDRIEQSLARYPHGVNGNQPDGPSAGPSISADGRYISFISRATNLVTTPKSFCPDALGGFRPCADVYLLDRESGEVTLVSQKGGISGSGDSGISPMGSLYTQMTAISGDGQVVAFYSKAENLGADPIYGGLFVYQESSQLLTKVDSSENGEPANGTSLWPSLSEDGRYLAFTTYATNLVTDDQNGKADIYLFDLVEKSRMRITTGLQGIGANGHSVMPSLSDDGAWLVFRSSANDLVPGDVNQLEDVFIHNLREGETSLISQSMEGKISNGSSNLPALSAEGDKVVFASLASNLGENDFNGTWDIFLFDRFNKTNMLITKAINESSANGPSSWADISGDGYQVVFSSSATNLVEDDVNGFDDIFLYLAGTNQIKRINLPFHLLQQ